MTRKERELDEEILSHIEMAARSRRPRKVTGGRGARGAAGVRQRRAGEGSDARDVGRPLARAGTCRTCGYGARLLRRTPVVHDRGCSFAGAGHRREHRDLSIIDAVRLARCRSAPRALAESRSPDMEGARGGSTAIPNGDQSHLGTATGRPTGVFQHLAWGADVQPRSRRRRAAGAGLYVSGDFFDVLGVGPAPGDC